MCCFYVMRLRGGLRFLSRLYGVGVGGDRVGAAVPAGGGRVAAAARAGVVLARLRLLAREPYEHLERGHILRHKNGER